MASDEMLTIAQMRDAMIGYFQDKTDKYGSVTRASFHVLGIANQLYFDASNRVSTVQTDSYIHFHGYIPEEPGRGSRASPASMNLFGFGTTQYHSVYSTADIVAVLTQNFPPAGNDAPATLLLDTCKRSCTSTLMASFVASIIKNMRNTRIEGRDKNLLQSEYNDAEITNALLTAIDEDLKARFNRSLSDVRHFPPTNANMESLIASTDSILTLLDHSAPNH
jgi:hypothetical protein